MNEMRGFSRLAVRSLATLVLAGCDRPAGSGTTRDGNNAATQVGGGNTGNAFAVDTTNKYPGEFPIAQYPGSKVALTSKNGELLDVLMSSTDDFDKVAQFYKDETRAKGFTVKNLAQPTGYLTLIASKGQQELTTRVVDQQGGQADPLTIAIRMQPCEE
jgi:hypothetical protein